MKTMLRKCILLFTDGTANVRNQWVCTTNKNDLLLCWFNELILLTSVLNRIKPRHHLSIWQDNTVFDIQIKVCKQNRKVYLHCKPKLYLVVGSCTTICNLCNKGHKGNVNIFSANASENYIYIIYLAAIIATRFALERAFFKEHCRLISLFQRMTQKPKAIW